MTRAPVFLAFCPLPVPLVFLNHVSRNSLFQSRSAIRQVHIIGSRHVNFYIPGPYSVWLSPPAVSENPGPTPSRSPPDEGCGADVSAAEVSGTAAVVSGAAVVAASDCAGAAVSGTVPDSVGSDAAGAVVSGAAAVVSGAAGAVVSGTVGAAVVSGAAAVVSEAGLLELPPSVPSK